MNPTDSSTDELQALLTNDTFSKLPFSTENTTADYKIISSSISPLRRLSILQQSDFTKRERRASVLKDIPANNTNQNNTNQNNITKDIPNKLAIPQNPNLGRRKTLESNGFGDLLNRVDTTYNVNNLVSKPDLPSSLKFNNQADPKSNSQLFSNNSLNRKSIIPTFERRSSILSNKKSDSFKLTESFDKKNVADSSNNMRRKSTIHNTERKSSLFSNMNSESFKITESLDKKNIPSESSNNMRRKSTIHNIERKSSLFSNMNSESFKLTESLDKKNVAESSNIQSFITKRPDEDSFSSKIQSRALENRNEGTNSVFLKAEGILIDEALSEEQLDTLQDLDYFRRYSQNELNDSGGSQSESSGLLLSKNATTFAEKLYSNLKESTKHHTVVDNNNSRCTVSVTQDPLDDSIKILSLPVALLASTSLASTSLASTSLAATGMLMIPGSKIPLNRRPSFSDQLSRQISIQSKEAYYPKNENPTVFSLVVNEEPIPQIDIIAPVPEINRKELNSAEPPSISEPVKSFDKSIKNWNTMKRQSKGFEKSSPAPSEASSSIFEVSKMILDLKKLGMDPKLVNQTDRATLKTILGVKKWAVTASKNAKSEANSTIRKLARDQEKRIAAEIPHTIYLDLAKEILPILGKFSQQYKRQLGETHVYTRDCQSYIQGLMIKSRKMGQDISDLIDSGPHVTVEIADDNKARCCLIPMLRRKKFGRVEDELLLNNQNALENDNSDSDSDDDIVDGDKKWLI